MAHIAILCTHFLTLQEIACTCMVLHQNSRKQWRIQDLQTGGQGRAPKARGSRRRRLRVVERRRREYRGAEGAEGGGA